MLRGIRGAPVVVLFVTAIAAAAGPPKLERIKVAADGRGFATESGKPFLPWGFNYDHDDKGRLLEDYWDAEWSSVVGDFAEMKALGGNVVRIHLQTGKFLVAPDRPNEKALAKLRDLVALAERTGLYLDVTGLGCYHKKDVPAWYDELDEKGRWGAQATFWEAVAKAVADSPAIFCLDLMNEPVVPGGKRAARDWLGPAFGDKHFVQVITLDQAGRPRPEIARRWIEHLVAAVRKTNARHLVTVGLVDWSLERPGLTSGFVPSKVAGKLDFLCVHVYPQRKKLAEASETLAGFQVGKPVVIEETFPLQCSALELVDFLARERERHAGVVSFYWGKTPEEMAKSKELKDAIVRDWLQAFLAANPNRAEAKPAVKK